MKRVSHWTSPASAAKRSSASGSRSTPISVPAGPSLPAISRAWPTPATVASTARAPGRASTRSISSPARTGMCVLVMSRSVAKARCEVGDTGQDVLEILGIATPVPDLQALARAGDHDLLAEAGVVKERGRDHHAVGGIQLGVK